MSEQMKDKLAFHARTLFDKHGYHGAGLREICDLAGCKMPTLYYHYGDKETLYDEVVGKAFVELVPRLWLELPDTEPKEHAVRMVIQKKHLSAEERLIYRLAIRTWLGFEDCGLCRQRLMAWEQETYENSWKQYSEVVGSKQWAKYISRGITSMIQRIILLGEDISEEEIREEIGMIFDVAAHSNKESKGD